MNTATTEVRGETGQILYALIAGSEMSLMQMKWKWQHQLMNSHHADVRKEMFPQCQLSLLLSQPLAFV